jgi:hypothetical protein
VDAAAAGFGAVACAAGFVAPAGAVAAGLAGSKAVPDPAVPALWPNADAVASIVAMATIVIVRMSDAPGMRRDGADVEIDPQLGFGTLAHESCILIKLLLGLLHCRKTRWAFVAFDMSPRQLMWFAKAAGRSK